MNCCKLVLYTTLFKIWIGKQDPILERLYKI